jgi:hypothetical protein
VYFNLEIDTFWIFALSYAYLTAVIALAYRVATLIYQRQMRWTFAVALAFCMHPNFYAFWATWNYLNDRFFAMWYSQVLEP